MLGSMVGCGGEDSSGPPDAATVQSFVDRDDDPVEPLAIIPLPADVTVGTGHLHLDAAIEVPDAEVTIDAAATELGDEGYRLDIDDRGVRVVAATEAGAFYAERTLAQLVQPGDDERPARLPFVSIVDQPRFEWRGFMLDVSRHFFDVDVIRRQIDVLADYKINRLHLHLTDDQGWRIQIDEWPDLTATGAAIDIDGDGPGGFLTHDDLTAIVEHAAARFITVVPEIDLPGHVNAALASYPELNESGQATELVGRVPFGQSALSLGAPATRRFIDDVIDDVAQLTPGPYIHIGGDEALTLEHDEYAELVTLAAQAVVRNGKIPVGWEETATADLPMPSVTQYWFDVEKARRGTDAGSQLIASPADRAYLDQGYDDTTPLGLSWAGFVDVDTGYRWDPTDDGFTEDQILGVEAPLWTETIATEAELEYMAYPRLLGYAEIGWSPREARDWEDYRTRLAAHGPRLTERGIAYFASATVDWPPQP